MARPFPFARVLLMLGACGASSALALDRYASTPITVSPLNENKTPVLDCTVAGAPGPATCSDANWVNQCGPQYGSIDPNDTSGANPCIAPIALVGGGTTNFVEEAQSSYQTANQVPLTDSIFQPEGFSDGVTAANTDAPPLKTDGEFVASFPPQPRAKQESLYGPMVLKNSGTPAAPITSWANQESVAQYNAWNLTLASANNLNGGCTAGNPGLQCSNYQRYQNTLENFETIQSCENYVYRSFDSQERWIDAINACQGNDHCKVNVSMEGYTDTGVGASPAIFRARPTNADGAYVYDPTDKDNHITELVDAGEIDQIEADPFDDHWQLTNMPKNKFYAGTEYLFTTTIYNSMLAQGIDAQGLVNELVRGDQLYESGTASEGVPTKNGGYYVDSNQKLHRGFHDEWDYENFMNQGTQTTTDGESREYRRRNDQMYQAWVNLTSAMTCLYSNGLGIIGQCGRGVPSAMGMVWPGDEQEYEEDPLVTSQIISEIAPYQAASPPSLTGQIGFGANLSPSNFTLAQIAAAPLYSGAQAIPTNAHAPGQLVLTAPVESQLLGALDIPAALLNNNSIQAQIAVEDIAVTEARTADEIANINPIFGGILDAIFFGGSLDDALAVNRTVAARRVINGSTTDSNNPTSLANYVQPWSVNCGSTSSCAQYQNYWQAGSTPMMVEQTWETNNPRWTTDANGAPILDCTYQTFNVDELNNPVDGLGPQSNLKSDLYHSDQMWPQLCRLTNVVLAEWNRLKAGHPSCLDHTSLACDWAPNDFVKRFVNNNIHYAAAAKEIEYSYCKRWTGGGQVTNSNPAIGLSNAQAENLTVMRSTLDARKNQFEKLLKEVPVQAKDNFGKIKSDSNGIGNSTFGGYYNYTLGWHTQVIRYPQSYNTGPTVQANVGKICGMGGDAQALFTAGATMFGGQFPIIDAEVQVNSNDTNTQGQLDGMSDGWAMLTIAGESVFADGNSSDPIPISGSFSDSKLNSDKPEFIEAPFQVGWITVTVTAGILFQYGAPVTLLATSPVANTPAACDPVNLPAWEAKGSFTPQADLGVWVDADVSLAGVFGVGIEVDLILVGLGLPLTVDVKLAPDPASQLPAINFDAELDLTLNTMSGELDFYIIAFWCKVASFKIVGWDGFTSKFPIFRTRFVPLILEELPPGSIAPAGGTDATEDI